MVELLWRVTSRVPSRQHAHTGGRVDLVNAARQHGVDVIVIGSHNRNWLSKLFHGSTSADVLDEADIPVFVVPAEHPDG
jgi:nucleotide-binding universal stress UspA family protein